jgi:hypothetical protein
MAERTDRGDLARQLMSLLDAHGVEGVTAELRRILKKRPGRRRLPDWTLLHCELVADARDLLAGAYPKKSAYALAREFAAQNPDPMVSPESVAKRIERKLKAKRELFTLYHAFLISRQEGPWERHLWVLRRLQKEDPELRTQWLMMRIYALEIVCRCFEISGELSDELTFVDLVALTRRPVGGMMPADGNG